MRNFLTARWQHLIMINYAVPQELLKPHLPAGCELDLYHGRAYVSLVGFMFKNTHIFKIPIPWLGSFEEINLRFYVLHRQGNKRKRGVVFINETVPYKLVAWMANKLYKEHYTAIPTKHTIIRTNNQQQIAYQWKVNKQWNSIKVNASVNQMPMLEKSFEEFIFEHYYGYTKLNSHQTEEYEIEHPRWNLNSINTCEINCDFNAMYGTSFACLNNIKPDTVFLAEGSRVAVKWKRRRF